MKKIIVLLTIVLFTSFHVQAKKVAGKIITADDTIDVLFKIPQWAFSKDIDFKKLQGKVQYYTSSGEKKVLRPDDAKEIQFTHKGKNIRMMSRYKSIMLGRIFSGSKNIFLHVIIDGEVKLFGYYESRVLGGSYGTSSSKGVYIVDGFILQKRDDKLLKIDNSVNFKNSMIKYFFECPEVVEKLKNKTYRLEDIEIVVQHYNAIFGYIHIY